MRPSFFRKYLLSKASISSSTVMLTYSHQLSLVDLCILTSYVWLILFEVTVLYFHDFNNHFKLFIVLNLWSFFAYFMTWYTIIHIYYIISRIIITFLFLLNRLRSNFRCFEPNLQRKIVDVHQYTWFKCSLLEFRCRCDEERMFFLYFDVKVDNSVCFAQYGDDYY